MNLMHWLLTYPELLLLGGTCAVLLIDVLWADETRRLTLWLTQLLVAAFALLHGLELFSVTADRWQSSYGMQSMMVSDPMGHLLSMSAALALMVTLVYAQSYVGPRELRKGELYALSLFSLLGMAVMIGANHFLMLYVGLELMSLSLYALAALRRDHTLATEAGMKYFVLGALASGFLLYGMSMLYGATGTLFIPRVMEVIATGMVDSVVLTFGCVFIVTGVAFKLGVVPFHMWVPDVYQGAPTAVTLMIAAAPKLAAFAITMRLLVEGLFGLAGDWQAMLVVLSVGSMVVGNLVAIAQTNLKRMLAYSGIAQLGFMLLGFTPPMLLAATPQASVLSAGNGYSSALFYILTYVLTTLGSFGLLMLLSNDGHECEQVTDLAGLGKRAPWQAAVMSVFMFSLAGVPPLVGFYAKFAILQALVATDLPGYIALAVVAVMLSLIGAYYYLRVVKVMYFDAPAPVPAGNASRGASALLAANGLAVLLLGLWPAGLMLLCRSVIQTSLAG